MSQVDKKIKNDSIRIIKRNLVYVIGLDPKISNKEILMKKEYMGQYGKITRLIVNNNKAYNPTNSSSGPSYSAYINYNTEQEAALAILSIDSSSYNSKQIKAAFGTTKYCAFYLKKVACPNKDCVYIHSVPDKSNIISKESSDFYIEQHKIAVKVSEIGNMRIRELLYKNRNEESVFPNPFTIYFKKSIIAQLKADGLIESNFNPKTFNFDNIVSATQPPATTIITGAGTDKKKHVKGLSSVFEPKDGAPEEAAIPTTQVVTNSEVKVNNYGTKTIIKEIHYENIEDKDRDYSAKNEEKEEDFLTQLKEFSKDTNIRIEDEENQSEKSKKTKETKETKESRREREDEKDSSNNKNNELESEINKSQISTRVNSKSRIEEEKLKKNYLFRIKPESKFDFVVNDEVQISNFKSNLQCKEEPDNESKLLRKYYLRYSFSNLVKIEAQVKRNIEEDYFNKLQNKLQNEFENSLKTN